MVRNGHVFVRRRQLSHWFTGLLILLPFCFGTLNELLGLPWGIRYLLDVSWVALLMLLFARRYRCGNWKVGATACLTGVFLLFTGAVYGFRYQSGLYYLWGMRNTFRFYAAFFAFACFLTAEDSRRYLKILDMLFWVNALVSVWQFFVLGLAGDFLGGIFGVQKGGNAYTNLFFIIITAKSLVFYLEKRESFLSLVAKCLTALAVAAMAELKFFFVEMIVILLLAVCLTGPSRRKLWIVLGGLGAVFCGAALLTCLFPEFEGWFSADWLVGNALSDKGYTSAGDLNRLNAIHQINRRWLRTAGQRLVGLGLGNCETSTFALLNTPFFRDFGEMHYTWIGYAFLYLETGWIGLGLYLSFFAMVFLRCRRIGKDHGGELASVCCLAQILAVLCPLVAVYNSSLRTEAAYMVYFILAVPFAMKGMTAHGKGGEGR